jgi:hypothetical protein
MLAVTVPREATMTLAAGDYPFVELMWSVALFFGLLAFFGVLITVFGDLFRRQDIGGWAKTAWTVAVLVLPLVGGLVYLIGQGRGMADRTALRAERLYGRPGPGSGQSVLDDVARGKQLLDNGAISLDEFEEIKRRALTPVGEGGRSDAVR